MGDEVSTKVHKINTQKSCASMNQSCYPPPMVRGDRIESLLKARDWSQADLARKVGVSPQSIWKLVSGNSQGSKHLHRIARDLGTSVEYLTGETDDPAPGGGEVVDRRLGFDASESDLDLSGIVWIKEVDLVLGLGGSFLEAHVDDRRIPFPAHWIRNYSEASPEMLGFVRSRGTSMEPTITDRAMCLLDFSRITLDEQDELWACAYGEIGMIKRLRQMPDGTVKIMSDNEAVRDEIAADGELHIIGRCCGVFRRT